MTLGYCSVFADSKRNAVGSVTHQIEAINYRKCQEVAIKHEVIIFLHDNARPHVVRPVNNYLENSDWEFLPHTSCSPDLVPYPFLLPFVLVDAEDRTRIRVLKISLIHYSPSSRRNYFGMESTKNKKDGKLV